MRRALVVVTSTILAAGCSSNKGTITLENDSASTIARASLRACDQTFDENALPSGGKAVLSYKINCEGHYDIVIDFESGKTLESHEGYVTSGIDLEDKISVLDSEIKISRTGVR